MNKHNERAKLIAHKINCAHAYCQEKFGSDNILTKDLAEVSNFVSTMLEAQPADQANGAAAWADDCRIQLVTAIHGLASNFENALYAFRGDSEARKKAEGDIAHAMSVASRWNWNGRTTPPAQPAREWVGLTDDERQPMIKRCAEYYGYSDVPLNMTAGAGFWFLTKDVESKLREKNAGIAFDAEWLARREQAAYEAGKNAGLPAAVPDDIPAILKKQAS